MGMNASLSTNYFHVLDGRLATASLNFANPLGGLDLLLHGSSGFRGWGSPAFPDQVLYTVRGFDPSADRFLYTVNPRFGSARPSQTIARVPFRMTLSVRLELGSPQQHRLFLRFLQMDPLRKNEAPAPVDSLRSRLGYQVGDGYSQLIFYRDSLLLTPSQIAQLNAADTAYRARVRPIWQDLATYIAAQGEDANLREVNRRLDEARVRVWAMEREEIPKMMAPLTVAQRELAQLLLQTLINSDKRRPPTPVLF
jgi:hypothetical protein